MSEPTEALFVGGLLDGERRTLLFPSRHYRVYMLSGRGIHYERTHETASGLCIYEPVPDEKFFFVVEVEAVEGADAAQIEHILNDTLSYVEKHHEALPSGVRGARVSED